MPVIPASPTPSGTNLAEWLEIDGFSLSTPGWTHTSLAELLADADLRTGSRVVPLAAGELSYQTRIGMSRRNVPLKIYGDVDELGAPYANGRLGVETNLAKIQAAVTAPAPAYDGTRQGILHLAIGTRSARVKVISPLTPVPFSPTIYSAVLELELPYGAFV